MDVTPIYFYDPSTAPGGEVSPDQILAHISRSVEALPIMRSRLERAILNLDNPYLVEDEHFDIRNNLRQVAMPEAAAGRCSAV